MFNSFHYRLEWQAAFYLLADAAALSHEWQRMHMMMRHTKSWKMLFKTLARISINQTNGKWEVVVAQLVERSLSIPEVCGSNAVIGNIYIEHLFTINCIEKTKINKKISGMAHFKKTVSGNLN